MRVRFTAQVFAWVTFGVIAMVIITAILASAVTAAQVAGNLRTATGQLEDIRQADAKAETARVHRSAVFQQKLDTLQRQNDEQLHQAKVQRHYMALLAKILRTHGIPVPPPPRVTVTSSPKGPRRSHPATRGHTGHGPRSPESTSPACELVPVLCPFLSVPTLLP